MSSTFQNIDVQSRASKKEVKGSVLRREGFIPGVIFGKGMESINIKIKANEWTRFSQKHQVIFNATIEGGKKHLVALNEVDRDPLGKIQHLSLHKMKKGQKAIVTIPVHTVGEKHKDNQGIIFQHINELRVEAIPTDVPESFEIDITKLMDGQAIHIKDLVLTKGVEIQGHDADDTVVECRLSHSSAEETADDEAETEVEGSEDTIKVEAKEE